LPSLHCTFHLLLCFYSITLFLLPYISSSHLTYCFTPNPCIFPHYFVVHLLFFSFVVLFHTCDSPCPFASCLTLDTLLYCFSFHISFKVHTTISSPLLFHYLLFCTLQPSTCHA
jgi:hypothetical protein